MQALRFFIEGRSGLHWQLHLCQVNVLLDFEGLDVYSSDSALVEYDDFWIGLNVEAKFSGAYNSIKRCPSQRLDLFDYLALDVAIDKVAFRGRECNDNVVRCV